MHKAPGFHGKAPALGDFVSRRLPAEFLSEWDCWMQVILPASRAALGADWLAAWNEAPVWHFGLGAGVAGPEPYFGVLIPSVDRVGRQFPFSILGPSGEGGAALPGWSLRVETLALAALEDHFDPSRLAAELEALGPPEPPTAGAFAILPPGATLWACRDAPRVPASLVRYTGLPSPAQSVRLIAGVD